MTSILSQQKQVSIANNSNAIISKSKKIFSLSYCISGICIKFWILWKKRLPLDGITFSKYRLQKAGLLKSVKSLVSEHLWTVNMLKGPKECLNLQGSIFVIPFDNSERKSARKPLILVYLKSSHIDTVS